MPEVDTASPQRLHELVMELIRATGLLQPELMVPDQQISLSQAFALHELTVGAASSQQDLAERLGLEKSSVSRMAAEMERKGLLLRERDPGNRRHYRLRLTDRGRALHDRMAASAHELFIRWTAALRPTERAALMVGLPALVRVIRADTGPTHGQV